MRWPWGWLWQGGGRVEGSHKGVAVGRSGDRLLLVSFSLGHFPHLIQAVLESPHGRCLLGIYQLQGHGSLGLFC